MEHDKLKGSEGAGALDNPALRESYIDRPSAHSQPSGRTAANATISEDSAGRPPPESPSLPPRTSAEEHVTPCRECKGRKVVPMGIRSTSGTETCPTCKGTGAGSSVSSAVNVLRSGLRNLTADERQALLAERQEMLQLLANGLSSGEGWSAKDEGRAAELVRLHL